MQILKSQKALTTEVETQPQVPLKNEADLRSEEGLDNSLDGFFGLDAEPENTQPVLKPFDALFASKHQESVEKPKYPPVPALDELLMEKPELRFKLELVQNRYEKARSATFNRIEKLKAFLQTGSFTPGQQIAAQSDVKILQTRLGEIDRELEKLEIRIGDNADLYFQEISDMKDLNGDGYIGDPNDPDNHLILAKHPNGTTVALDPKTMKPAEELLMNPDKKAQILSTDYLEHLDKTSAAPLGDGQIAFDEAFRIKAASLYGPVDTTFGALIDVSVPETLLVEKTADGKPKLVQDGFGRKKYAVKTMSLQENRFGQESLTEAGRKDYMAIKVAKVNIFTDPVGFKDNNNNKIDGGHVYIEFKDRADRVILRIRVEGVETPNDVLSASATLSNSNHYTAATTVGIALNAGNVENSKRVSPVEIDTTGYQSTGRLKMDPREFYSQLGMSESYSDGEGHFADATGMPEGEEKTRKEKAANDTLYDRFFGTGVSYATMAHRDGEPNNIELSQPLSNYFGNSTASSAYISTVESNKSLRFGVAIVGLRGNMTLGNDNNIVVQPPPNSEDYLASLPPWMDEVHPEDASYRTTVDAGGGSNILISNGGDIFAKGITFFERKAQPGEFGNQIWVELNNNQHDNHATYVNVQDPNPEILNIVNGDDTNPAEAAKDASKVEGIADDWFNDHTKLRVSDMQNDLPDGLKLGSEIQIEGLPQAFEEAFGAEFQRIREELIEKDPLTLGNVNWAEMEGQWEFGEAYHQDGEKLGSFFDEYSFFKPDQEKGDMSV